ncbi:hypothetical protein EOM57_03410 [Candidatus Saccharibacteria bacterium]|nr:hypothetical protein [Candidatus Saccharibacteria bacterium]
MKLSSPAFDDNALIPKQYSRLGGDVSPPLEIGDVPNGAASLALVCHDPDVSGSPYNQHTV